MDTETSSLDFCGYKEICVFAMENYSSTIVECIRKPKKLTQEEKNKKDVHMFCSIVRFSEQAAQIEGISFSQRD